MDKLLERPAIDKLLYDDWKKKNGNDWIGKAINVLTSIESDCKFCTPGNRNWSAVDWMIAMTIQRAVWSDPVINSFSWYMNQFLDRCAKKISANDQTAMIDKMRAVHPYLPDWGLARLIAKDRDVYCRVYEDLGVGDRLSVYCWWFDNLASKMVKYVIL